MARARAFRTQAIARIWEELRFAPPATLARMAEDAEEFAALVEPLHAYPEEAVVERITRYRRDTSVEGDLVVGEALLADLTSFVERATARAPLPVDARGGALTLVEAAARLAISRTTLDRYRARGLICHYVLAGERAGAGVHPHATPELCVFADVLDAFAAQHPALVERAAATGRLDAGARAALATLALERLSAGPASVEALARQLAPQAGRSVRTVRRALEGDPHVCAKATRRTARTLTDDDARRAARAWQLGISPQQMAAHGTAGVAACIRAVQRGRALALHDAIACAHILVLPNFSRPDSAVTLLAPPLVRTNLPSGEWRLPTPRLASASQRAPRALDTAAVVAQHFLLWRAAESMRGPRRPESRVLDAAECDLRWAYRLRRAVVQAALPDALARVAQHLGAPWARLPQDLQWRWAAVAARTVAQALDFRVLASVTLGDVHPLRAAALAVERMLSHPDLMAHVTHTPPGLHAAVIAPWMAFVDSGDRWSPLVAHVSATNAPAAAFVARRFGLDGLPPARMVELAHAMPGSTAAAQARLYAALATFRALMRSASGGLSAC